MKAPPPDTKRKLQVSVRKLVEFLMRSGDLSFEFTGANRSLEAIRVHQKIQSSRPENYQAEVTVSRQVENEAFDLTVSGRADGAFLYSEILRIEEIKTTTLELDQLTETDHPLHWGQVKCYGAMLGAERKAAQVDLQLTYANLDTGDTRIFERRYALDELEVFSMS